jgi:hypothetical protein
MIPFRDWSLRSRLMVGCYVAFVVTAIAWFNSHRDRGGFGHVFLLFVLYHVATGLSIGYDDWRGSGLFRRVFSIVWSVFPLLFLLFVEATMPGALVALWKT